MNDAQILEKLTDILANSFEIERQKITKDAHLFEDLGLDSIDAVDLAIKLQDLTGKRIKPEDFKSVRTVQDAIHAVKQLSHA